MIMHSFNNSWRGRALAAALAILLLAVWALAVPLASAEQTNGAGGTVEVTAMPTDSASTGQTNAAEGTVVLAGIDQASPDLTNVLLTVARLGIFDPVHLTPTRSATSNWSLYE